MLQHTITSDSSLREVISTHVSRPATISPRIVTCISIVRIMMANLIIYTKKLFNLSHMPSPVSVIGSRQIITLIRDLSLNIAN